MLQSEPRKQLAKNPVNAQGLSLHPNMPAHRAQHTLTRSLARMHARTQNQKKNNSSNSNNNNDDDNGGDNNDDDDDNNNNNSNNSNDDDDNNNNDNQPTNARTCTR